MATEPATIELVSEVRTDSDVVVAVGADGTVRLGGEEVPLSELDALLLAHLGHDSDARVVVTAEKSAPVDVLVAVISRARLVDVPVALEVTTLGAPIPDVTSLFPEVSAIETLEDATLNEVQALEPKRGRLEQQPRANTTSYTAYALEPGEVKIGLGSVSVGVLPRVQVGTSPLLDVVGAFNINAKANLVRQGRFDGALLAQAYRVPLMNLVSAVGAGDVFAGPDGNTVMVSAAYVGLGATGSVQLAKPWSAHAQLYWGRPSARGDIAFDSLPEILLPGLSLGDTAAVGLGVIGDLAVINLATDLRFNRRDSVFAWVRYPFHGRVRGLTSGEIGGFENLENAEFIVAYGDFISFADSYSVAVGYQGSWKHFEGRAGLGLSAVPGAWLLQAFELSYKFGGQTRRTERAQRQGYKTTLDGTDAPVEAVQ